jgi:hypothetical protein
MECKGSLLCSQERTTGHYILSQMHPFHNFSPSFPEIHFNGKIPICAQMFHMVSSLQVSQPNFCVHVTSSMHATFPAHPFILGLITLILFAKHMMVLITQSSPLSCHFLPLRSTHSPQHLLLIHPQSVFFL